MLKEKTNPNESSLMSCLFNIIFILTELSEIEPNVFLRPFLEVIRSEDTTGPITGLALTSVNKFLSYALIGMLCGSRDLPKCQPDVSP